LSHTKNSFSGAKYGYSEKIEAALIAGINIETKDSYDNRTPLIALAEGYHINNEEDEEEYLKALRILIDAGANLNAQDHSGKTALFLALENSRLKLAEELIKKGADTKIKTKEGKDSSMLIDQMNNLKSLISK